MDPEPLLNEDSAECDACVKEAEWTQGKSVLLSSGEVPSLNAPVAPPDPLSLPSSPFVAGVSEGDNGCALAQKSNRTVS